MSKTLGLGTVLRVEDPSTPGTFVAVGELTSLPAPNPTKNETEVTSFDSTAREFLGTLPDNGTIDFSGFFDYADAGQLILLNDALDSDSPVRSFEIYFARQGVTFEFDGFVTSFAPSASGVDDAISFDGSIRVTGAVTHTEDS